MKALKNTFPQKEAHLEACLPPISHAYYDQDHVLSMADCNNAVGPFSYFSISVYSLAVVLRSHQLVP